MWKRVTFDQTDPHYSLVQLQLDESHETCTNQNHEENDCQENVLMQKNWNEPTNELHFFNPNFFSFFGVNNT